LEDLDEEDERRFFLSDRQKTAGWNQVRTSSVTSNPHRSILFVLLRLKKVVTFIILTFCVFKKLNKNTPIVIHRRKN